MNQPKNQDMEIKALINKFYSEASTGYVFYKKGILSQTLRKIHRKTIEFLYSKGCITYVLEHFLQRHITDVMNASTT